MEYITLGKTESSVSNISLGTWAYGGSSTSGNQSVGWADQADIDSKKALLKAHSQKKKGKLVLSPEDALNMIEAASNQDLPGVNC